MGSNPVGRTSLSFAAKPFVDASYRLELGERVVAVDERRTSEVVAFGEDRRAVVSTWGLRTLLGNAYWAVTTTVVGLGQTD